MKQKSVFICSSCGAEFPKWLGKCSACESWGTLEETVIEKPVAQRSVNTAKPVIAQRKLSEISAEHYARVSSGSAEFDRVLGGGIVRASVVLCGGDPGIGKSTLLLQVCGFTAKKHKVLYVSAEESAQQIKLRADRLNINADSLYVLTDTDIDEICAHILSLKPDFAVIDSIQTVFASYLSAAPGTVSQVRECALRLMRLAKENDCTVFTVGHVTKEGSLAGPKVLEHIVDTVLYFEGERNNSFRVLRTTKNRFGSTNEIGIFEMNESGMQDVPNPSEMFLSQRTSPVSGTAVLCTMEGTRPVVAEIEALLCPTGFGTPRRVSNGIDYSRMVMLLAVLEKQIGCILGNQDVYVNAAGGLHIDEPAIDLPLIAAVTSSYKNTPISDKTALFGEVGLTGELRAVSFCQQRIDECRKLGFKKVILPTSNKRSIKAKNDGISIEFAGNLYTALKCALKE